MNTITKTPLGVRERENRRKNALRVVNRAILIEIKASEGCSLCGRRDLPPRRLAFHHNSGRTKLRKLCHMVSASTAALLHEVGKCRLVCVDAHRTYHATGVLKPCAGAFAPPSDEEASK